MPRKSKAALAAEAAALEAAPAPARRGRPPRAPKATPEPSAEEASGASSTIAADAEATTGPNGALMPMDTMPMDTGEAPTAPAVEATPPEPTPASPEHAATPSKSAARWDPAADTVQFDWPEIEQTASRPGPNQVMAKLLVAARAEGATSRWPFGES